MDEKRFQEACDYFCEQSGYDSIDDFINDYGYMIESIDDYFYEDNPKQGMDDLYWDTIGARHRIQRYKKRIGFEDEPIVDPDDDEEDLIDRVEHEYRIVQKAETSGNFVSDYLIIDLKDDSRVYIPNSLEALKNIEIDACEEALAKVAVNKDGGLSVICSSYSGQIDEIDNLPNEIIDLSKSDLCVLVTQDKQYYVVDKNNPTLVFYPSSISELQPEILIEKMPSDKIEFIQIEETTITQIRVNGKNIDVEEIHVDDINKPEMEEKTVTIKVVEVIEDNEVSIKIVTDGEIPQYKAPTLSYEVGARGSISASDEIQITESYDKLFTMTGSGEAATLVINGETIKISATDMYGEPGEKELYTQQITFNAAKIEPSVEDREINYEIKYVSGNDENGNYQNGIKIELDNELDEAILVHIKDTGFKGNVTETDIEIESSTTEIIKNHNSPMHSIDYTITLPNGEEIKVPTISGLANSDKPISETIISQGSFKDEPLWPTLIKDEFDFEFVYNDLNDTATERFKNYYKIGNIVSKLEATDTGIEFTVVDYNKQDRVDRGEKNTPYVYYSIEKEPYSYRGSFAYEHKFQSLLNTDKTQIGLKFFFDKINEQYPIITIRSDTHKNTYYAPLVGNYAGALFDNFEEAAKAALLKDYIRWRVLKV